MTPNALCFGSQFPVTGSPCHVEITPSGMRVRLESQPSEPDDGLIPFSNLSVSSGGLHHDQLVVQWSADSDRRTLFLKDPEIIRSFRETAPKDLTGELEEAASKVRKIRRRRRMAWIAAGSLVAALALFMWFGSNVLVDLAVSRIPIEWEKKLGEAAYRDFLAQQTVVKEGQAVAAVSEMTRRLTERISDDPYEFQVTVVRSDVVNAFALPGGYVVVFTGLMKKAENGEEVAGVLSHELNHVLQRHGLERIVKQLGLVAALSIVLGDQQGLIGLTKQVGVELLTLRFGREQETEADVTGVQLLHRANIDSHGMIRFFERLSEQQKEPIEILSTHPMSAARAARLKAEVAALPKQTLEPFTFDWKAVQDSLAGS
ncbi:MAG: M48 family metalloprotease [Nitrospira sp. CR1.3]|nr:M48 family metalloprotease [Nitrospira sp. CR1.3]